jgi:hypothetical protein
MAMAVSMAVAVSTAAAGTGDAKRICRMRKHILTEQEILMSKTISMETANIPDTGLTPSRVALGTWAIGGWMWGH